MNKSRSNVPLVVIIGLIGSGKTTLTQNINVSAKCLKIPEPVEKWESCGILKDFYSDMKANAFSFQIFAFASRASQFKEIEWSNYDVCIADSHTLSDRHVFSENLFQMGFMTENQNTLFCENWKKIAPEMIPDLFKSRSKNMH